MKNVKRTKISVCMPVYNGRDYIAESIASVLAQSYEDFYLVIVDNCSTDDTPEIIRKINDSRIRYVRNEKNLGLVGNHDRCIQLCETPYINIWHNDDIMMPKNLEAKLEILESHPQVGLVFSNVELIDEKGKKLSYDWTEECRRDYIKDGKDILKQYVKRMHIGALFFIGAVLSRKEILLQTGGFKADYSSLTCDSEIWLRALLISDGACLGEPLVKYRNYEGSTTNEYYGVKFLKEHQKVVSRIFHEYQSQIPDCGNLKREVEANFVKHALRKGINACGVNDFKMGKKYLSLAKSFSKNNIYRTKEYWGLQGRLFLGSESAKYYRSIKKGLGLVIKGNYGK